MGNGWFVLQQWALLTPRRVVWECLETSWHLPCKLEVTYIVTSVLFLWGEWPGEAPQSLSENRGYDISNLKFTFKHDGDLQIFPHCQTSSCEQLLSKHRNALTGQSVQALVLRRRNLGQVVVEKGVLQPRSACAWSRSCTFTYQLAVTIGSLIGF